MNITADTENIEYRQLWGFLGVLSTCDQNVNRTKHLTICAAQIVGYNYH